MFLYLLELHSQGAEYNEGKLMNCSKVHGLHEEYLKKIGL
jgi:hypothetical protein